MIPVYIFNPEMQEFYLASRDRHTQPIVSGSNTVYFVQNYFLSTKYIE